MTRRLALLIFATAAATACATTGAVPRPFPGAPTPPAAITSPAPSTKDVASALISTALSYRGVPYRNGGSDPMGFDCSGFVQWVFAQQGHALPREVHQQYSEGRKIDRDEVKPGDLVFFHTEGKGASHVGIALGNGDFVHAPSSRGVVRIESYDTEYWKKRFVGARRVG